MDVRVHRLDERHRDDGLHGRVLELRVDSRVDARLLLDTLAETIDKVRIIRHLLDLGGEKLLALLTTGGVA